MTEGKGYCARRQEAAGLKKIAKFIENKDNIVVIPDNTKYNKKIKTIQLVKWCQIVHICIALVFKIFVNIFDIFIEDIEYWKKNVTG